MTTGKKVFLFISISILLIIIAAFLVFASIAFIISGAFALFMPSPEKPVIKYSEFDYRVEYSINGVDHTKNGVIKCKYEGVKSLGTAGKYREWSLVTSDNVDRIVLWDVSDRNFYTSDGDKITEFYLDIGTGGYYMNDETSLNYHGVLGGFVSYKYIHPEYNIEVQGRTKNDEALEKYGIYIDSWEIDPPIENKFY